MLEIKPATDRSRNGHLSPVVKLIELSDPFGNTHAELAVAWLHGLMHASSDSLARASTSVLLDFIVKDKL